MPRKAIRRKSNSQKKDDETLLDILVALEVFLRREDLVIDHLGWKGEFWSVAIRRNGARLRESYASGGSIIEAFSNIMRKHSGLPPQEIR